jgi:hypothetical protein
MSRGVEQRVQGFVIVVVVVECEIEARRWNGGIRERVIRGSCGVVY